MESNQITIFTDGASKGNPGPGGWGVVIVMSRDNNITEIVELGGREDHTTNNRMELCATIKGISFVFSLNAIRYPLLVYTDSRYLINGITKWVFGWQKNGWKTAAKKDVENRDLWEELFQHTAKFNIEWKYIGGRSHATPSEQEHQKLESVCVGAGSKDGSAFEGQRPHSRSLSECG